MKDHAPSSLKYVRFRGGGRGSISESGCHFVGEPGLKSDERVRRDPLRRISLTRMSSGMSKADHLKPSSGIN